MIYKYKRNITNRDLFFVLIWIVVCIYAIRILAVCLKVLISIADNGDSVPFWLQEYAFIYKAFGVACIFFCGFTKYVNHKVVCLILFISLFTSMIVLYYIQPYHLWDMLLGYKFVPINQ